MNQVIKGNWAMIISIDIASVVAICIAVTSITVFKLVIKWFDYDMDKDIKKIKSKGENNG